MSAGVDHAAQFEVAQNAQRFGEALIAVGPKNKGANGVRFWLEPDGHFGHDAEVGLPSKPVQRSAHAVFVDIFGHRILIMPKTGSDDLSASKHNLIVATVDQTIVVAGVTQTALQRIAD